MTAQAVTAKSSHLGPGRSGLFVVALTLGAALASGETLTVTLPTTLPRDSLPVRAEAWHNSTGNTWIPYGPDVANRLVLTSHEVVTGVTILTAGSSGLAAGDKVVIMYGPST